MIEVLLFGSLYCLPLFISLVVGGFSILVYWREQGLLTVGDCCLMALWFAVSWCPGLNIVSSILLLVEANQKHNWTSRVLIKSKGREREDIVNALRGDS